MNTTTNSRPVSFRQQIDEMPMSFHQYLVIGICFLLNIADGFDVLAMSYAGPALREDWSVAASELGIIFSAALAGMMIGALVLSPMSDKFGRRKVILLSVAITGLSMLATIIAESIPQLIVIRFFTGIGIGGILASAASIASEYSSAKVRSLSVIVVTTGYTVGAILAGPIANVVIPNEGWQQLFYYGGVFTVILFFLALFLLPESIDYVAGKPGPAEQRLSAVNKLLRKIKKQPLDSLPDLEKKDIQQGNVMGLFHPKLRRTTFQIWTIMFTGFWSTYFMVNWIPTLFVDIGFSKAEANDALILYTIGGLVGALLVGFLSTRLTLNKLISSTLFITCSLLAGWAVFQPSSLNVINITLTIIGFFFTGGFTAMYALIAQNYPSEVRTTGVGWGIGLGRFGAVLSPMVAGILVGQGWDMYDLFLMVAIPPALAAGILIWLLPKPVDSLNN